MEGEGVCRVRAMKWLTSNMGPVQPLWVAESELGEAAMCDHNRRTVSCLLSIVAVGTQAQLLGAPRGEPHSRERNFFT